MSRSTGAAAVPRERVIAKLKSVGYAFYKDAWRVSIFKLGTHQVHIPKRDLLDAEVVQSILGQAKCAAEDIRRFLGAESN